MTSSTFVYFTANFKEIELDIGWKNRSIVTADATAPDSVAGHILNVALWNICENCSAIFRLIVHRDVKCNPRSRAGHRCPYSARHPAPPPRAARAAASPLRSLH